MSAAGGVALAEFTDYMRDTGPAIFTGPEAVIREAVKQTYLLGRMLQGDAKEYIQGGTRIQDNIDLIGKRTFGRHKPGATLSTDNKQTQRTHHAYWRFAHDHMTWTDQEHLLQGVSSMTRGARVQVYKNLKRQKEAGLSESLFEGMEDELWAPPSYADMEAEAGEQPYSIPCFINEGTDGKFDASWATVMGLNPATPEFQGRWQNKLIRYDYADPDDGDGDGDGLLDALSKMQRRVRYQPVPMDKGYFESDAGRNQLIVTQTDGADLYEKLLRESGDRVFSQDPGFHGLTHLGARIQHITALDEAELYPAAGFTFNTWNHSDTTNKGPRFYFLNFKYLKMFFHKERYFHKKAPMQPPNQPESWVQWVLIYNNLFCRSRQRLGLVAPGA